MRSLSPEEQALWARVAATIRPLSRDLSDIAQPAAAEPPPPHKATTARRPTERVRPAAASPSRSGTTLDGSWDRKLSSGAIVPDRVLDLHGLDLDRAWRAIDLALEQAIAAGERVVLLITGHARPGDPPLPRGRIRAAAHDWLAVSRHSGRIAAVRPAHRRHGGGGSLYIVLRRR